MESALMAGRAVDRFDTVPGTGETYRDSTFRAIHLGDRLRVKITEARSLVRCNNNRPTTE